MRTLFATAVLCLSLALQAGEPPRYSQEDGYVTAPPAVGLPKDGAVLSRTHPGLYAEYGGLMFQHGAPLIVAPDQPLASMPHADWAEPEKPRSLTIVAIHRTDDVASDVYRLAERLGAQVKGVPIAHRVLPKPPQGVLATEISMKRLREVLAGEVDVIMVNKLLLALPAEAQQLILDKVKAGAGLLTVAHLPAEGPLVEAFDIENPGASDARHYRDFGQVTTDGSWLTGGILFDLFPSRPIEGLTPWHEYDPRCLNIANYRLKDNADAQVHAWWQDFPLVITDTLGKGRVVHIAWMGNQWDGSYVPHYVDVDDNYAFKRADHYYEQIFAVLAKAVEYAHSGAPSCRLVWPDNLQGTAVRVANAADQPATVRLRVVLRDPISWETIDEQTTTLTVPAGGEVAAPAPKVPIPAIHGLLGEAPPLVEYTLRDAEGNSLDFGNTRLPATGQPPLAEVASNVAYPGQSITLDLTGDLPITWQAKDVWGRVVDSGSATGGKLTVTTDRLSALLTVTVEHRDDAGQLLAQTTREVWAPVLEHPRDYYNLIWPNAARPYMVRDFNYHVMRRQGGINTVLGSTNFGTAEGAEGQIRGGARLALTNVVPRWPYKELSDWPETFEKNLAIAKKVLPGNIGRLDPMTVHLMDERHSRKDMSKGFKISDAALDLFRDWLRKEYATINQLNAVWLTDFQDFNQVVPVVDPKEVIQQPASYARWMDLLSWADTEIALKGDLAFIKILQKDCQGKISFGFEGIFPYYGNHLNPYGGLNVPAIFDSGVQMNNMAYGIGSPTWELCASLNPAADSGTWLGYESGESVYRLEPWRGVLSGATFIGWFMDSLWFTPQGAVGERLSWIERYTRPLRQGVGRMMNESTRHFDDVAILANMRSAQLSWMYGIQMQPKSNGRGHHWMSRPMGASHEALLEICRDYGLSPAYITEGQVLGGRLDQFKVLIQPSDLSVDPKIAAAIGDWVKRGGILISDMGAGAYDQHGRMLEDSPMNAIYGIKRNGPFTINQEAGDFSIGLLDATTELIRNGSGSGNWYMTEYYEPNLEATTAHVAAHYYFGDKSAMCFWNQYGEGRTLYLGFLLNRFNGDEDDFMSVRPLIHAALRIAGVQPQLRISNGDGVQLIGFTVTNFYEGDVRYSGVIKRSTDAPTQVTAHYPQPRHVYNVMTNHYLGHGKEISLDLQSDVTSKAGMPMIGGETLASNQATIHGMALLAALPYELTGVGIQAEAAKAGEPLPITITVNTPDGPASQRHVVYLDVRDPDGRAAEPYCHTILVENGKWQGNLPLAQNERAGTWHLTIREPITAKTAETRVAVR